MSKNSFAVSHGDTIKFRHKFHLIKLAGLQMLVKRFDKSSYLVLTYVSVVIK